jgi:hypothetical protein
MGKSNFDYQEVKKARNEFINESVINLEIIRPVICKSWNRSRNINAYNKIESIYLLLPFWKDKKKINNLSPLPEP